MNCERMICKMKYDLNNDPMYSLGAAFFSGFLFSSWSWGIIYVILFLIVYEIGYYGFYCYKGWNNYNIIVRIGIVAGALMGFLIGRNIIEDDDHEQSIHDFRKRWGI